VPLTSYLQLICDPPPKEAALQELRVTRRIKYRKTRRRTDILHYYFWQQMRNDMLSKALCFLGVCIVALTASCKKDNNNNTNPASACNGKNLCMKIGGTSFSEDAVWREISTTRRRILWETGSGTTYKNVELDIYDMTANDGTFQVAENPGAGQAGFQYFTASPASNISGVSGTVTLTSAANNTLSGTFVITAKDQNNATVEITEGNFVNVPKQ